MQLDGFYPVTKVLGVLNEQGVVYRVCSKRCRGAFGVSGCSDPVAGNSMETENSVAFRAIDAQGEPMTRARARAPSWFVADSAAETDTGEYIRNATTDKTDA